MERAAKRVRTVEVTRAVRAVRFDGVQVDEGAPIALIDGRLVASGANLMDVAITALEQAEADRCELITVYYGEGISAEEAQGLGRLVGERWTGQTVEVVDGGQPHYPYLISVE
jgi:dihydroxyacetone kinase-like predicted kinase